MNEIKADAYNPRNETKIGLQHNPTNRTQSTKHFRCRLRTDLVKYF